MMYKLEQLLRDSTEFMIQSLIKIYLASFYSDQLVISKRNNCRK